MRHLFHSILFVSLIIACDSASEPAAESHEPRSYATPTLVSEAGNVCLGDDGRCADGGEMLVVFQGLVERHLAGYPGGASEVEKHFQTELMARGVDDETLWEISDMMTASADLTEVNTSRPRKMEPITREWLEKRLGEDTRTVLERTHQRAEEDLVTPRAAYKYQLSVQAVQTHRCANDVGWESGCDKEEPSIAHGAWGAGWHWVNETNTGSVKNPGDQYWFSKNNIIPSSIPWSYDPMLHIWQVVENDPEEGNFSWANAALAAASAVAKGFGGDWFGVVEAGLKLVSELKKVGGNGDDLYPLFFSIYDAPTLQKITGSIKTQPQPKAFFSLPAASYYKSLAIYNTWSPGNWNVITTITRSAV